MLTCRVLTVIVEGWKMAKEEKWSYNSYYLNMQAAFYLFDLLDFLSLHYTYCIQLFTFFVLFFSSKNMWHKTEIGSLGLLLVIRNLNRTGNNITESPT